MAVQGSVRNEQQTGLERGLLETPELDDTRTTVDQCQLISFGSMPISKRQHEQEGTGGTLAKNNVSLEKCEDKRQEDQQHLGKGSITVDKTNTSTYTLRGISALNKHHTKSMGKRGLA